MSGRTIAVVSAGLSDPSTTSMLAERLALATRKDLAGEHGISAAIEGIGLRELAHDLTNNLLTGFASERLQAAKDTVAAADGVIAVTPIFSGSFNGLFKNFFDLLEPESLAGSPVLVAATAGTARHSLALDHALRPLFAYLRAVVVPTGVFAALEDWGSNDRIAGALNERIERAAGELAALVASAPRRQATDSFADLTPFEQLLRGA